MLYPFSKWGEAGLRVPLKERDPQVRDTDL